MGRERIVSSPEAMLDLGKRLGASLAPNAILALSGDLGAGKTTLVQGLALGLGIEAPISSPTFIFLNSYDAALPLYHFDLYRMRSPSDFLGLGFDEYLDKGGICAIEWPERIEGLLPAHTLRICISHLGNERRIAFSSSFQSNLLEWAAI